MSKAAVYSLKELLAMIEDGEKMFIPVEQFGAFAVETELLGIFFCIKSSVVGDQIVLERWDIGEAAGLEKRGVNKVWLH